MSSETERPIEIRAASNNAVRIWLNGKEIYFREEYHHGMEIDQHIGKGILKAGRNEILIKVCQNEQTDRLGPAMVVPVAGLRRARGRGADHECNRKSEVIV